MMRGFRRGLAVGLGGVVLLSLVACEGNAIGVHAGDGGIVDAGQVIPDAGQVVDAGGQGDGGLVPACAPAPVSDDQCINCLNPEFQGAFWDGMGCFELIGCACTGDGCTRAYDSVAQCEAAQADCDSSLCEATEGDWYPGEFCGPCGHYFCGLPSPLGCCAPGCDCGPGRNFVDGVGCQVDAQCAGENACQATGGQWHPQSECICGFVCGQPGPCDGCLDSCDCGPHRNFDAQKGCLWEGDFCASPDEQALCQGTFGTWHLDDGGCGHFTCGLPNMMDPCVSPGCDCGPHRNFDSALGCVYDETCVLGDVGEPCRGNGPNSDCRAGLVCCSGCGMAPGCQLCTVPCCEADANCGDDGCYPPPP